MLSLDGNDESFDARNDLSGRLFVPNKREYKSRSINGDNRNEWIEINNCTCIL